MRCWVVFFGGGGWFRTRLRNGCGWQSRAASLGAFGLQQQLDGLGPYGDGEVLTLIATGRAMASGEVGGLRIQKRVSHHQGAMLWPSPSDLRVRRKLGFVVPEAAQRL